MICPQCSGEFVPGITECPDCEVRLVEPLAAPDDGDVQEPQDLGELVPLVDVSDPALLPVLRSVLEAAGIPVLVQGEHSLTLSPAMLLRAADPANICWRVMVPEQVAAEARALLEQLEGSAHQGTV